MVRRLRRALQHILGHRDRVWLTRPRDICAHVESLPSGIVPVATTGEPSAYVVRYLPMASKFSKPKPTGSISLWQPEQAGLLECAST